MLKKGHYLSLIFLLCYSLSGCIGGLWTGATLVYDRHNVYRKLNDYNLAAEVNKALYSDKLLKSPLCVLDFAVFNGDILITGHLPSQALLNEVNLRLKNVRGYQRLYNQIRISQSPSGNLYDAWITAKIRSEIFADDSIDPNAFKVITVDQVVYIMGEVKLDEAKKVIQIARYTDGVKKVVKILRYYTYQK